MILDNVFVLELAAGISGPLTTLRLSDLGASVVKVELAGGDYLRCAAPQAPGSDDSAAFVALNRGKRSLGLGQDPAAAAPVLVRAATAATVVVNDWTEAELAEAGLAEIRLEAATGRSGLVWIDISDYGRIGPLVDVPGSELVGQAFAGYTRYLGRYGEVPLRLGASIGSTGTGILAAQAVLAALLWRKRTGARGQAVDLSRVGTLLAMKSIHLAAQSNPDSFQGPRVGGANYPPDRGWRAGDGYLTFSFGGSVGRQGRPGWIEFVKDIGLDWMLDDPRFSDDPTGRLTTGLGPRSRDLRLEYEKEFLKHPAAEVVALVRKHGGAASVYQDHGQVVEHEQTAALNLIQEIPDDNRAVRVTSFPARFSSMTTRVRAGVPRVGQHTTEVAAELGFDAVAMQRFIEVGALIEEAGSCDDGR